MRLLGELLPFFKGFAGACYTEAYKLVPRRVVLAINGEEVETRWALKYRGRQRSTGAHPTGLCGFRFRLDPRSLRDGDTVDIYEERSHASVPGAPFCITSKQVYFMHIPKTAGSALNAYMLRKLGKQNTRVHIEGVLSSQRELAGCQQYAYVSGHPRMQSVARGMNLSNFLKVTLLRDPYRRLLSHMAWNRRLAEQEHRHIFLARSRPIQDLAIALKNIDLSNLDHIRRFVAEVGSNPDSIAARTLDNNQTRHFLRGTYPQRIAVTHLPEAKEMLRSFDLVGTSEQFDDFLASLSERTGWRHTPAEVERVNVQQERFGLDASSAELKEALRPLWCLDEELYWFVRDGGLGQ